MVKVLKWLILEQYMVIPHIQQKTKETNKTSIPRLLGLAGGRRLTTDLNPRVSEYWFYWFLCFFVFLKVFWFLEGRTTKNFGFPSVSLVFWRPYPQKLWFSLRFFGFLKAVLSNVWFSLVFCLLKAVLSLVFLRCLGLSLGCMLGPKPDRYTVEE